MSPKNNNKRIHKTVKTNCQLVVLSKNNIFAQIIFSPIPEKKIKKNFGIRVNPKKVNFCFFSFSELGGSNHQPA